jgi:hypothetical protein
VGANPYELAQVLYQRGVWAVCTDEKTSIQAREGIDAPQPAAAGHAQHIAAHYERRGALQLFADLSVADGQVFGCCRERRCFVDFQAFILEVLVPEAMRRGVWMICLILDNGPTHAPKQLELGWPNNKPCTNGLSKLSCFGCPNTLPGWIRLKSGSASCNARSCRPIILKVCPI